MPTTATPTQAERIEEAVKHDLAERLKISEEMITMVSGEAVDWGDASLGCPQPGMVYAQVITPGYKIVLQANGQDFAYHTGSESFVLCEHPSKAQEPTPDRSPTKMPQPDPQTAAPIDEAKQDLSRRSGLAVGQIHLQSVETVQWRDSSLGCPQPGMHYLMVITPGYLIKLEAGGKVYEYHASGQRAIYCDDPQSPLGRESGSD
jgi:hypothetical protein